MNVQNNCSAISALSLDKAGFRAFDKASLLKDFSLSHGIRARWYRGTMYRGTMVSGHDGIGARWYRGTMYRAPTGYLESRG